jgi:methionine aminotransferase
MATPALQSRLPAVGTTVFSLMSALASEHGAVNLGQGFPDFECDPGLLDRVNDAMRAGHNQYPITAATAVASINVPMVSTLILPSAEASRSLRIAEMIDTIIKGTTNICSSLTYPVARMSRVSR